MPFVKFDSEKEIAKQCVLDPEFKRIHEENMHLEQVRLQMMQCIQQINGNLDRIKAAELADEFIEHIKTMKNI